jgi:ATP-dependent protease ClpP protease subunit
MAKIIELKGEVGWEITDRSLRNKLPNDGSEALIIVDSYGGSVYEGNRLYNTLLDHVKKFPGSLKVELGVIAASAASYFPLAVGAENISARENTVFMIHKAWGLAIGNSDEMQLTAKIFDGFDRMIAKTYTKITGESIEDTLEVMKNELWLMGGQAVVDAGFATNIVESSEEDSDETNNIMLNKNEVSAKLEEIKNKLKEIDNKEDLEKWSAKLEIENKTESNPPNGDGNIEEEDISDMKLEEYLNSNPEAKAENDLAIKNAVAEGIKAEKERGDKYFNLAGATVPKELKEAYKNGLSTGDYAEAEMLRANEAKAKAGDTNLGALTVKDQTPGSEEAGKGKKETVVKDSVKEAFDTLYPKGETK